MIVHDCPPYTVQSKYNTIQRALRLATWFHSYAKSEELELDIYL